MIYQYIGIVSIINSISKLSKRSCIESISISSRTVLTITKVAVAIRFVQQLGLLGLVQNMHNPAPENNGLQTPISKVQATLIQQSHE